MSLTIYKIMLVEPFKYINFGRIKNWEYELNISGKYHELQGASRHLTTYTKE